MRLLTKQGGQAGSLPNVIDKLNSMSKSKTRAADKTFLVRFFGIHSMSPPCILIRRDWCAPDYWSFPRNPRPLQPCRRDPRVLDIVMLHGSGCVRYLDCMPSEVALRFCCYNSFQLILAVLLWFLWIWIKKNRYRMMMRSWLLWAIGLSWSDSFRHGKIRMWIEDQNTHILILLRAMLGLAFAVLNVSHTVLYSALKAITPESNAYFSHGLLYQLAYRLASHLVVAQASYGVCEF